jgi:hypothetical protein
MTANSILAAYFISVVIGAVVSGVCVFFLFRALDWQLGPDHVGHTQRIWWIPMLMGITERAIITTLVIWTPKLLVGFIAGWMALKVAGGWGLLKEPTPRNRSTNGIALLGSVISLGWAIGVSVYFAPTALTALSSPN